MTINAADLKNSERWMTRHGRVVFCSGSFDIPHVAHVLFFEECRAYGTTLIVGVGSDKMLSHLKQGRPIMSEQIRLRMVDSLKPVTWAFIDTISTPEEPLGLIPYALENLRPHSYVIKDETFGIEQRRAWCEQFGVKLQILERREDSELNSISTTSIIEKIGHRFTDPNQSATACRAMARYWTKLAERREAEAKK